MLDRTVGVRIREAREGLRLAREGFTEKLGVSANYLYEIETGRKAPSETLLLLIEVRYNINPQWLRAGEGEMFTPPPQEKQVEPSEYQAHIDKLTAILGGPDRELAGRLKERIEMLYEQVRDAKKEDPPRETAFKRGA